MPESSATAIGMSLVRSRARDVGLLGIPWLLAAVLVITGPWFLDAYIVNILIRAFFVAYLYGEHELMRMRRTESGLYYVPPPVPQSDTYDEIRS